MFRKYKYVYVIIIAAITLVVYFEKYRYDGATQSANAIAARIWTLITSEKPEDIRHGWQELAISDPEVLRRAIYSSVDPASDLITINLVPFEINSTVMKRMDEELRRALATNDRSDVRAYIALDALAAGIMSSYKKTTVDVNVLGIRPFAYDKAIVLRLYALQKIVDVDPGSPYGAKQKIDAIMLIARSGKVSPDTP